MRFMSNPFDILIVASTMLPSVWWPKGVAHHEPGKPPSSCKSPCTCRMKDLIMKVQKCLPNC